MLLTLERITSIAIVELRELIQLLELLVLLLCATLTGIFIGILRFLMLKQHLLAELLLLLLVLFKTCKEVCGSFGRVSSELHLRNQVGILLDVTLGAVRTGCGRSTSITSGSLCGRIVDICVARDGSWQLASCGYLQTAGWVGISSCACVAAWSRGFGLWLLAWHLVHTFRSVGWGTFKHGKSAGTVLGRLHWLQCGLLVLVVLPVVAENSQRVGDTLGGVLHLELNRVLTVVHLLMVLVHLNHQNALLSIWLLSID